MSKCKGRTWFCFWATAIAFATAALRCSTWKSWCGAPLLSLASDDSCQGVHSLSRCQSQHYWSVSPAKRTAVCVGKSWGNQCGSWSCSEHLDVHADVHSSGNCAPKNASSGVDRRQCSNAHLAQMWPGFLYLLLELPTAGSPALALLSASASWGCFWPPNSCNAACIWYLCATVKKAEVCYINTANTGWNSCLVCNTLQLGK